MWLRRYVFSKNYITFVSKLVREYHPEHNLTYNPEDKALEWMDPAAGSGVSSAQQQKLAHRNVGLILVQFATRVVLSTLVRYKVRWKGRPVCETIYLTISTDGQTKEPLNDWIAMLQDWLHNQIPGALWFCFTLAGWRDVVSCRRCVWRGRNGLWCLPYPSSHPHGPAARRVDQVRRWHRAQGSSGAHSHSLGGKNYC